MGKVSQNVGALSFVSLHCGATSQNPTLKVAFRAPNISSTWTTPPSCWLPQLSFRSATSPAVPTALLPLEYDLVPSTPVANIVSPILSLSNVLSLQTKVDTIGVLGAGQMGGGIAQVAAQISKKKVILVDLNQAAVDKALAFMGTSLPPLLRYLLDAFPSLYANSDPILCCGFVQIDSNMKKQVAKGKLEDSVRVDTMSRIVGATSMSELAKTDFVIEAVTENPILKNKIFADLSNICPSDVILASNTSSISITSIAAATNRPDRVVGMHFMNPVPVMKLVEIIPGLQTSNETLQTTLSLAQSMDKITTQSKDMPGFIANRLLMPYINEAVFALAESLGTKEDIDATMKLGTNMPMGPLTLADFIGLDTCLAIMRILHTELGDSKYRPAPLLVKYVEAGWLGKKSGRGFYDYTL